MPPVLAIYCSIARQVPGSSNIQLIRAFSPCPLSGGGRENHRRRMPRARDPSVSDEQNRTCSPTYPSKSRACCARPAAKIRSKNSMFYPQRFINVVHLKPGIPPCQMSKIVYAVPYILRNPALAVPVLLQKFDPIIRCFTHRDSWARILSATCFLFIECRATCMERSTRR